MLSAIFRGGVFVVLENKVYNFVSICS